MAPKIKVPMDFGVHLRSSPTHNTLKLNTSEGGEVLASSVILSFNSPVIDHMTTTLHMTSVDMLEFSEAAVQVFVDASYSGTAEGLNREIFRDINKMANVFEVAWLAEKCSEYFTEVTNSVVTQSYSDLLYLFEEACFVLENLNKKDYIELANDKIQELDWKQQFIDKYLENADRLSTKKLDIVIELAGSDVNFVVQTLVNQLTELFKVQGPSLPVSCKYLLDTMDLSACVESGHSDIFYKLFEVLQYQELPLEQIKWSHNLLLLSTKKCLYSDTPTASALSKPHYIQTSISPRCNTIPNLYHNLDFGMNFDELLEWISVSECVNSLLMAIEAVFTWSCYHFATNKSKNVDSTIIRSKLGDAMLKRKDWSLLPSDFRTLSFRLYNKYYYARFLFESQCLSKDVSMLKYDVLNCLEMCLDPLTSLSNESKLTFHFKHPSVSSCNRPGVCGFILKTVPSEAALWKLELCTEKEDYNGIDVHFHEEVRAENMHVFFFKRTEEKNFLFPLTWLGCIYSSDKRDKWRSMFTFDSGSRFRVLYKFK